MLIRMWMGVTILLDRHPGMLAVELEAPVLKDGFQPKVEYFGTEGIGANKPKELTPSDDPKDRADGLLVFFMEPPIKAPPDQNRRHRYLITYEGGDTYVRHPVHCSLTLTEHNNAKLGRCWELNLEGVGARIVMPSDFYMVEEIQTS